jgi:hypothetical protein
MSAQHGGVFLHMGGLTAGAEDLVVYLAANRPGLRRAGYGLHCFDPAVVGPDTLSSVMPGPDADDATVAAAAARIAARFGPDRRAGSEGFVVCASELAGPSAELLRGDFHPSARLRARTLRQALGRPVDRLVLSVQPYDVLFHSVWMMLAADRRVAPFEDFVATLQAFRGGWADLGEALVEELEVRELIVTTAPASPQQTLPMMVPGLILRQPVMPLPKPKVTQSAVVMLQRCMAQGTPLQPGQRDRLIAFHARQPQLRPDTAFSALALSDLRGRYVGDLDALARLPGARVIGAPMPALAAE